MQRLLRGLIGWGLLAVLCGPSCGEAERDAFGSEPAALTQVSPETCSLGSLDSISRCGGGASCHVCARLDAEQAICVQPCTIGGNDCPSGQTCLPIGALRDAGGYARIGDCPAGYCR